MLFADDTNMFYSNENFIDLVMNINYELGKLKTWLDNNKLSLNLSKTKLIMFGNYKENADPSINISGTSIEKVPEIKFLGITIDIVILEITH